MANYVDGYIIPIKKTNIKAYKKNGGFKTLVAAKQSGHFKDG